MKRILAIFGLTLALAACSDNNTNEGSANSNDTTSKRPSTEATDTSSSTKSEMLDPSGGPGGVRSGIGTGDPAINTGNKSDSTKN